MNIPRQGARTPGGTNISITGSPGAAIASGDGARASGYSIQAAVSTLQRIDQLLAELQEAAACQLEPGNARDVAGAVESVRAEAHHSRPSADRIRQALGRLTAAVLPAAGLLANVEEIRQLMASLVH